MNSNKWVRRAVYIFLLFFIFALLMIKDGDTESAASMLVVGLMCSGFYIFMAYHSKRRKK